MPKIQEVIDTLIALKKLSALQPKKHLMTELIYNMDIAGLNAVKRLKFKEFDSGKRGCEVYCIGYDDVFWTDGKKNISSSFLF